MDTEPDLYGVLNVEGVFHLQTLRFMQISLTLSSQPPESVSLSVMTSRFNSTVSMNQRLASSSMTNYYDILNVGDEVLIDEGRNVVVNGTARSPKPKN